MKRIGVLLTLMAFVAIGDRVYAAPSTWALVVGVSKYQNPMITGLKYPAVDATAISDVLTDPKLGHVPKAHVLLLADSAATSTAINGSVDTFFKPRVKDGDTVIVFLAGHGVTKGVGDTAKAYLLPTDVKGLTTQALDDSAVNLRTLAKHLGELPASNFVAFVDACREDPTPGRAVKPNTLTDVVSDSMQIAPTKSTRTVSSATFFTCSLGQRAYEDASYGHGVFTYWILDGIRRAAVPKAPDGAVEMGTLASYVGTNVATWARRASQNGDFEFDQTPEVLTSMLPDPLILMHVSRDFDDHTITPEPPKLIVAAMPAAASVSVDGVEVGNGTVEKVLGRAGKHTILTRATGYAPVTQEVDTFPGYAQQIKVELEPVVGAGLAPVATPTVYTEARAAEEREEYEAAEAGYGVCIAQHPDFAPAYEALAELERRQGRNGDYCQTLVDLVAKAGSSAHNLAQLSLAYSQYAFQGFGASTDPALIDGKAPDPNSYYLPRSQSNAGDLALKAAKAAVAADGTLPEAERSLGLALVATDVDGNNRSAALKALGMAVILDHDDWANHYTLGFAIRYYARRDDDVDGRESDLKRAVVEQQLAVKSHGTYEAYRELAYCDHLLGDIDGAQKAYEMANALRGAATDGNEVAGINCALAVLARVKADDKPSSKVGLMAASKGYWSDATDINPDLKKPLTTLKNAGLRDQVEKYLPDRFKNTIDWSSKS